MGLGRCHRRYRTTGTCNERDLGIVGRMPVALMLRTLVLRRLGFARSTQQSAISIQPRIKKQHRQICAGVSHPPFASTVSRDESGRFVGRKGWAPTLWLVS